MDELRRRERVELNTSISVFDAFSGQQVGELANINIDGIMLITDQALDVNSIFQYKLQLPVPIDGQAELELGVDCLWCREAENFNRHWAGFQIIDAAPEDIDIIAKLITEFAK